MGLIIITIELMEIWLYHRVNKCSNLSCIYLLLSDVYQKNKLRARRYHGCLSLNASLPQNSIAECVCVCVVKNREKNKYSIAWSHTFGKCLFQVTKECVTPLFLSLSVFDLEIQVFKANKLWHISRMQDSSLFQLEKQPSFPPVEFVEQIPSNSTIECLTNIPSAWWRVY